MSIFNKSSDAIDATDPEALKEFLGADRYSNDILARREPPPQLGNTFGLRPTSPAYDKLNALVSANAEENEIREAFGNDLSDTFATFKLTKELPQDLPPLPRPSLSFNEVTPKPDVAPDYSLNNEPSLKK